MVYDANTSDQYVVLFGGEGPFGALDDTWEFRGGTWTNVTPALPNATNTPSARYGATMAYDSTDGYVMLFGGASSAFTGSNAPILNDTWEFLHGNWTRLCGSCIPGSNEPGARLLSQASDDPSDNGIVLFGGLTVEGESYSTLNDTWAFAHATWAPIVTSIAPPARYGAGLSLVSTPGPLVLFGGCSRAMAAGGPTCIGFQNDSWRFSSNTWSEIADSPTAPGARAGFGFAYAASQGLTLAFGGLTARGPLNETWELNQGTWTDLTDSLLWSPSARDDVALTYDSESGTNYFVLFGGWNGTYLNETWVYPSTFSPLRVSAPVSNLTVTDVGRPFRLNVTISGGAGHYNRAWFGLPAGCPTLNTSSLVCRPAASGSFAISVRVEDAVGSVVWSGSTVVQVNPRLTSVGIGPVKGSSNEGVIPWNITLLANWTGGSPPFAFAWHFQDGTANGTGNPSTHEYNVAGIFEVNVTMTDGLGETATSGGEKVISALPLTAQLTANPNATTTGSETTFQVTATGGFPWANSYYRYAWSGLPSSCATANQSSISCVPGAPGTYDVSVTVTDSRGDSVATSAPLIVRAQPPPGGTVGWQWFAVLGVAGVVAIVVAVWAVRRVRQDRSASTERSLPGSQKPPPQA